MFCFLCWYCHDKHQFSSSIDDSYQTTHSIHSYCAIIHGEWNQWRWMKPMATNPLWPDHFCVFYWPWECYASDVELLCDWAITWKATQCSFSLLNCLLLVAVGWVCFLRGTRGFIFCGNKEANFSKMLLIFLAGARCMGMLAIWSSDTEMLILHAIKRPAWHCWKIVRMSQNLQL